MAAASYRGVVKDNKVVLQNGIDLPDGLEVEVIPIEQITVYTQKGWLEQARLVRDQITVQIGGYAGDSVKGIREIREDRAKAIGEQK